MSNETNVIVRVEESEYQKRKIFYEKMKIAIADIINNTQSKRDYNVWFSHLNWSGYDWSANKFVIEKETKEKTFWYFFTKKYKTKVIAEIDVDECLFMDQMTIDIYDPEWENSFSPMKDFCEKESIPCLVLMKHY